MDDMDNSYSDSIKRVKRLQVDREEELKIYPDLYNGDMPNEIYCGDQNNEEKCKLAFTRFCPQHFSICRTQFVKFRTSPVCRIRVEYEAEANDLPEQGDALKTLVSLLLKHVPGNCYVLDRALMDKKKVIIYYGLINCKCDALVFSMPNVEDLHIC